MSTLKDLKEIWVSQSSSSILKNPDWHLKVIQSEDCQSYIAWNSKSLEALLIDPKKEDGEAYFLVSKELSLYRWLAVVDTHTHADHISSAAELSQKLDAPLIMHIKAPSLRVDLRVSKKTLISSLAAPLEFIPTPGHTLDSLTVIWGPFVFSGDTILYGDVGRDDLPGGDAKDHYESLQLLKSYLKLEQIILPGHDFKGGRASTWGDQLKVNTSLTQAEESFIREAQAFNGIAPKLLKEALKENFK